jgi:hypothetical protein
MAKAKRTATTPKESDPQTQSPATSPTEAAELIARVTPAALVLFGQTVSPKVHSYPAGMALPIEIAKKARLRIDAWEETRAIRIRKNPFYLQEIDASAWRLAALAQAVAPLLADADLDYHNLLEMAWKLEKAGQVAEPTDWPGALHDFEAARPALKEGKIYYEAAAHRVTAAQAPEVAAPKAPPAASVKKENPTLQKAFQYICRHRRGCKAAAIAKHCKVEPDTIRNYAKDLKAMGITTERGCTGGYYPPPAAK